MKHFLSWKKSHVLAKLSKDGSMTGLAELNAKFGGRKKQLAKWFLLTQSLNIFCKRFTCRNRKRGWLAYMDVQYLLNPSTEYEVDLIV